MGSVKYGEFATIREEKPVQIGDMIKKSRMEQGFTLREFANSIGMTPTRLSQIERPHEGNLPPVFDELIVIALGLGISAQEIIALQPEPPRPRPKIEDAAFICGSHGCMSGQQLKALRDEEPSA